MKILLDSNILIYILNRGSVFHKKACEIVLEDKHFCITDQIILETYRVVTSKENFEKGAYTPKLAWAEIDKIMEDVEVYPRTFSSVQCLKDLTQAYKINSYKVYDAMIVAVMIENGIREIYTNNDKDFKKFKEIKVTNPFK